MKVYKTCLDCDGTGKNKKIIKGFWIEYTKKPCTSCGGNGRTVVGEKKLKVVKKS